MLEFAETEPVIDDDNDDIIEDDDDDDTDFGEDADYDELEVNDTEVENLEE